MTADPDLVDRLRAALATTRAVTEKRMFGGHAFLVGGRLAIAAAGRGGLLVRIDPARAEADLAREGVEPFEMRGRPVRGWLHVSVSAVATDAELCRWVGSAVAFVHGLPAAEAGRDGRVEL